MSKYKIEEKGHFDNGDSKVAVYKNGKFVGYKTYPEATNYVMRDGSGNDEWVEVYNDGSASQSTVGKQKASRDGFGIRLRELFGR